MSRWTQPTCERPSGLVEAVVWDFGNVLVDWDPARAVANRWPAERVEELAARSGFSALNDRLDRGLTQEAQLAELREKDPEAAEFWEHYVARIRHSLTPIAATGTLLDELADAGVPQYGLTNWPAIIAEDIPDIVPGAARLRGVVVSGLEGVVKPEPVIYERLIERFGLDPVATLFTDDREANVAAAAALGFHTHRFDGDVAALRGAMARLGLPVG